MSHVGSAPSSDFNPSAPPGTTLARLNGALDRLNRLLLVPCMVALLAASAILTYSVVVRYALKIPTDWQDEAAVFLLVGSVFLTGAHVQSLRGHVGIEALASLLPPVVNRVRYLLVDVATAGFCLFFAWKSWTLFHEAWVDKQTTTSSWGPPLWMPYLTMAMGMTLLALQAALQSLTRVATWRQAR